jgi:non-ribosomal peptide synthase protein (TIGR01720 family)
LGGHSLLAVKVVERMRRAGLAADVRTLFVTPTVAALAAEADPNSELVGAEDGAAAAAEGGNSVPLTPAMKRFLYDRRSPDPHHWNVAALLEPSEPIDFARLERAVRQLFVRHDSLSLGFRQKNGEWTAVYKDDAHLSACCRMDFSDLPQDEQASAVERACSRLQATFDLADGPLFRVAYFDLGSRRTHRVLVCAHHLVTDGFSFGVLIEDLTSIYRALGEEPSSLRGGTGVSYRQWAKRLKQLSESDRIRQEMPYWNGLPWSACRALPRDHHCGDAHNINESAREVAAPLTPEDTATLLECLPKGVRLEDALITSLATALADWERSSTVLIDRISHGREPIDGGRAPTHTVGFLIAYTPLVLTLDPTATTMRNVAAVGAQLRRIPSGGIGFDLLRYRPGSDLLNAPQSEVLFNYLGDLETVGFPDPLFLRSPDPSGSSRSPQGRRQHALAVMAVRENQKLDVRFVYSENLHRRETIERIAAKFGECVAAIVGQCRPKDSTRPSSV